MNKFYRSFLHNVLALTFIFQLFSGQILAKTANENTTINKINTTEISANNIAISNVFINRIGKLEVNTSLASTMFMDCACKDSEGIIFRYTGEGCSASNNSQDSGKTSCSGSPGGNGINISYDEGAVQDVNIGDIVFIGGPDNNLSSETDLQVGGQSITLHTSCSQPLNVGDQFGSLEVVGFIFKDGSICGVEPCTPCEDGGVIEGDEANCESYNPEPITEVTAPDCPVPPPTNASCQCKDSEFIIFTYTGGSCGDSNNSQPNDKWECSGSFNGGASANIQFKDGSVNVALGESFQVERGDAEDITISSNGGSQTMELHVSCSQPLIVGESFGALTIAGFIYKDGSSCGPVGEEADELEYQWISSTSGCPDDISQAISGATSKGYDPSSISQTTWYVRLARKKDCIPADQFDQFPNASCGCKDSETILFKYVGGNCNESVNSQPSDKWECSGSNNGAASVTVQYKDGSATVALGETFSVKRDDAQDMTISGGGSTQTMELHVSCSQPINLGDTYGALQIAGFIYKDGSSCELPPETPPGEDNPWVPSNCVVKRVDDISIIIQNKICNPNDLASTFDDTYTFDLIVNGTSPDGLWSGSFDNAFLGTFQIGPTPYGTVVNLGPFPAGTFSPTNVSPPIIVEGGTPINISVQDVNNSSCSETTTVQPPDCPIAVATYGDMVWNDLDKDGIMDANEPGVQGISVTLSKPDGSIIGTQTTDGNGKYLFTNLVPNMQYKATFTNLPNGFQFTTPNAGDDAFDSDVNPSTGMTEFTMLDPGEDDRTWDAGIVTVPPPPATYGDMVWNDIDKDGVMDANEPGVQGVLVILSKPDGTVIGTKITGNNGKYLFEDLVPNMQYKATFSNIPNGFQFTTPNAGNDAIDSDVNPTTGMTEFTTLDPGEDGRTWDAGIVSIPPDCNINLSIVNKVCDGKGTVTTTDDTYTFDLIVTGVGTSGLWQGFYSNGFLGAFSTSPTPYGQAVTLGPFPAGEFTGGNSFPPTTIFNGLDIDVQVNDVEFTNCSDEIKVTSTGPCSPPPPACIGDFVWLDNDGDGIQDANEPGIFGATVKLLAPNGTILQTMTTDEGGKYKFSVPPGDYKVMFNPPPGLEPCPQTGNASQGNNNDNDANPNDGNMTAVFSVAAGENNTTIDACFRIPEPPPACVGDFVWLDGDGDGIQDSGEPGIFGVTVKLLDPNGTVLQTTTTDEGGKYKFTTPPGSYKVMFNTPPDLEPCPQTGNVSQGNNNDNDADPNNGNMTEVFSVASGENNTTIDACFRTPELPPACIGDFVWLDGDGDGIQDSGEPGIFGVTVKLLDPNGTVLQTTTTDEGGKYKFTTPPGSYKVMFNTPPDLEPCPQTGNAGTGNNSDNDNNPNTGMTDVFFVNQGGNDTTIDACFRTSIPTCPDGSPLKTPGTPCDDKNPDTTKDMILGDGCTCQGTPIGDPCAELWGDTDGDGVCDDLDNCRITFNPDQADHNNNGIGDVCEGLNGPNACRDLFVSGGSDHINIAGIVSPNALIEYLGTGTGWALVGHCNANCGATTVIPNLEPGDYKVKIQTFNPYCYAEYNVTITGNTGGDPCADKGGDSDGDGICNAQDNCDFTRNPDQADNDGDGIGNPCDDTPDGNTGGGPCANQGGDSDGDGICNAQDNCDFTHNPDQADNDGDGIGNPCDDTPDGNGGNNSGSTCTDATVTVGAGKFTINNLAPGAKVEYNGPATGWALLLVCDDNCGNSQTVNNLSVGDYNIKIQTFNPYCYAEIQVTVSEENTGNGGDNNCNATAGTLRAVAENVQLSNGSTTISASIEQNPSIPSFYQQVYVLTSTDNLVIQQTNTSPSFTVNTTGKYRIHSLVFDPNSLDLSIILPGVTTGFEVNDILVQGGGSICAALDVTGAIFNVTESGGGNNTGNTCNDVNVSFANGRVVIDNLSAAATVDIAGPSTGWGLQNVCDGDCNISETVENLSDGTYSIKVQTYAPYCYAQYDMVVTNGAGSRNAPRLNFVAFKANQAVALQWLTNTGWRNDHFELERSQDGVNFEKIHKVVNTDKSDELAYYEETDNQPELGTNYYRLKQVYQDGSFEYTEVKLINVNVDVNALNIYPNPVKEALFIGLTPYAGKQVNLTLMNQFGQALQHVNIEQVGIAPTILNMNNIPNGLYQITIQVEGGLKPITKKILVSRMY